MRSDELTEEATGTATPLANPGASPGGLTSTSDARMPWLVLIGLGVGLLLAGLYLRFSTQPRAG
jgi:LPXTG-motif cell wall-anchored protein